MAHRVQIHHHLLRVLGQTAHPHLQQTGFHLLWIMRQLVTSALLVVGQLQPVERSGRRQRDASVRRVQPVQPQGILLTARRGQQRVQTQPLLIVEVFVAQALTVYALGQHLLQFMIHKPRVPPVRKTPRQFQGQPQVVIHLPQEQRAAVTRKRAARKIGNDLA